jgi:hypothetical protein
MTIPIYSMQNQLIGYASPGLARKLKRQGVAEEFTRDPYSLVVTQVPMLDHPLLKEATMAKKDPKPLQRQGINENKVPLMALTEKQSEQAPMPIDADKFAEEANRRASESRSGTVNEREKTDPTGLYLSNRYMDHMIVVSDVWSDKNDANTAMVFQPGEVKRLDTLGEMYVNGDPVSFKTPDDLYKSNRLTLLAAQKILVLGRLSPRQMVRHGYWDGKVSPKEVVDAMGSKTKGGNFQIEINLKNDWYMKRLVKQVKLEKEINDAEAGTDPDQDVLDAAEEAGIE